MDRKLIRSNHPGVMQCAPNVKCNMIDTHNTMQVHSFRRSYKASPLAATPTASIAAIRCILFVESNIEYVRDIWER